MNHEYSKLTLYVLNEGQTYESRCNAARMPWHGVKAIHFVQLVNSAASEYLVKFGETFTARERLEAASQLVEYYETHVKEVDK